MGPVVGAALLLLLTQAGVGAEAPAPEDVVVTHRRLKRPAGVWDVDRDRRLRNCRVFRSSGDAVVDRETCAAPVPGTPAGLPGVLPAVRRPTVRPPILSPTAPVRAPPPGAAGPR